MNVTRKDATIQNTGADDDFPGSFEVVLSTAAKDRDGDELAAEDWKQPLPDHITFDTDHGMSVATTVGSGVPSIEDGKLIVRGTYSSLSRAQETRTLVKEGHIRTTSVAFMSEKTTKDGKSRTTRELLNGAFVAIPANREAVVLAAKGLAEQVKAGARHSSTDMAHIQSILDHAVALGATLADDTGAIYGAQGGKSVEEQIQALAVQIKALAEDAGEITVNGQTIVTDTADVVVYRKDMDDESEEELPEVPAIDTAAPSGDAAKSVDAETLGLQNRLTVIKAAAAIAG